MTGMILIVDDDISFSEDIERIFNAWSQGLLNVVVAHSVGQAIAHLQNPEIALVITDVRMPVFDGIQFLRLIHSKHPNIKKVALTGYADDSTRSKCLDAGSDFFFEKPRDVAGFESLYNVVRELYVSHVSDVANDGFTGMLAKANLGEIIQMLCITGGTMIFEVTSPHCSGLIYIKNGKIIHAETTFCKGYDAFYQVMTLKGGSFSVIPYEDPEEITIRDSWEKLLIESARMMDEASTITEEMENFGKIKPQDAQVTEDLREHIQPEKFIKDREEMMIPERKKAPPEEILERETAEEAPPPSKEDKTVEKSRIVSRVREDDFSSEKSGVDMMSERSGAGSLGAISEVTAGESVSFIKMDSKYQSLSSNMEELEQAKICDLAELINIKSLEILNKCQAGDFKELLIETHDSTMMFSGPTVNFFGEIKSRGKESLRQLRKAAVVPISS